MKKIICICALLAPLWAAAQGKLHFAMQPAISADAKTIYFEYDGDIWSVPTAGGDAKRITAMTGYESMALPSPDGKWLAFAANRNGNNDVFIVSTDGGDIRQLTFHDANDNPVSWAPDSKSLNIESARYNGISAYKVGIDGGTPVRIFPHYFNTIANLQETADGKYVFNESTESYRYATRKGYKGDHNPDIKVWDPKTKTYKELTTYNGKDIWPSVDKEGNIYFATDEKGEYNLATIKNGKTEILTNFERSTLYPKVSFNGEKIVFNLDYTIGVYDIATGKTTFPEIRLAKENGTEIPKTYDTNGKITALDVSKDGKKLAFVSRGVLFVSDAAGKSIKQIKTDPKERVVEIAWADDNKTILFTRTRNGWYNLYRIDASKEAAEQAVHTPNMFVKNLAANNDRTQFAFSSGDDKVELFDIKTNKVSKVADAEFWSFRGYNLTFSPDGKFLAFDSEHLFEKDVYVVNLATKERTNITNSAVFEYDPAWSHDNKSLYLLADRMNASFPRGSANASLYKIDFDKYDTFFNSNEYTNLFAGKKDSAEVVPLKINLKNIHRRWDKIENRGTQNSLYSINSKKGNYLLYNSNHTGTSGPFVLTVNEKDQKPAKKIDGITAIGSIATNGDVVFSLSRGEVYSLNLRDGKATKIELKQSFDKTNREEFDQMLYEVWAVMEANFYDSKFHGKDWNAVLKYYSELLPYAQNRKDLRTLANDMLGELNASHLGFTSNGPEEQQATRLFTHETGIIFDNNKPYVVDYIVEGTPADRIGVNLKKGDELIAVNGVKVDPKEDRNRYFTFPQFYNELKLTFKNSKGTFDVNLHTIRNGALKEELYNEWEDNCRAMVDQKTDGKVAYVHLKDMSEDALSRFMLEMTTDAVHKDALILDLRFNNGGNIHNEVLEYLSQKSHFKWNFRDKELNSHPNVTPADKPIVVLINERSLSDAEVTSNGIRNLGIAKLIGTETYRWIIFTSSSSMVDGSSSRMPAWGCYNLNGDDLERTGVKPDIYVKNTFEDRLNGRDPQLDRAIEEILKEMKTKK